VKRIVILGSSGSIGDSTIRIVRALPEAFEIVGIAVDRSVDTALAHAREFGIPKVAVSNPEAAEEARRNAPAGTEILAGPEGVVELAALDGVDIVVGAIVGMAGLRPVLAALEQGTDIALATKEVLVAAGHVVTETCRRTGARLLPVDSEPSAIFQCIAGKPDGQLRRLILTASGGPFSSQPDLDLASVTVDQALNHPRWDMGPKVTIDSATLMNKGLEVLESSWLFDMPLDRIDVVVHPESIVHSMVEFLDGSILAQLSLPDMRFAIQYALTHPGRLESDLPILPITEMGALHFGAPDVDRFPCLALARAAGVAGGTCPAVLNAANEIAVARFVEREITFPGIWKTVEQVLEKHTRVDSPGLNDVVDADAWARAQAAEVVG